MGVHDWNLSTNLDFGGNQALNHVLEELTADPGSPLTGRIWVRTDTKLVKWYDGTTIQTLADMSAVPNTITAADGTITVAGTTTAVTLKVAPGSLTHTYITDFISTVETVSLDQMTAPAANVSMNNHNLTTLSDPVNSQDAVNLRFLQSMINGYGDTREVAYATTAALPFGPAVYNNGTSGVGATLTGASNGVLVVDGQNPQVGQSILVGNEVTSANDGGYLVSSVGSGGTPYVLTRRSDMNTSNDFSAGMLFSVQAPTGSTAGTVNNGKLFIGICKASGFVVGTDPITFGVAGSAYTNGTGITLTGNVFSLTAPVTVALGGTGSTTAGGARTNLGVPGVYTTSVGDGSLTTFTFTHGLSNGYPGIDMWLASTGVHQNPGLISNGSTSITAYFSTAPATNDLQVTIVG
jgi:hypothetical protein